MSRPGKSQLQNPLIPLPLLYTDGNDSLSSPIEGGTGTFFLTLLAVRNKHEAFQVLRVENGLQALALQG